MSIYTKTGDHGETGLFGGSRIPKDSLRIEAIGSVDELNAALGALLASDQTTPRKGLILRIQNELFTLGAELADPEQKAKLKRMSAENIHGLEAAIDELEMKLPKLNNFILPGGTFFSAQAQIARAVCRRAELLIIKLQKKERVSLDISIYINRLSDLLFMLAREDCFDKNIPEIPWEK